MTQRRFHMLVINLTQKPIPSSLIYSKRSQDLIQQQALYADRWSKPRLDSTRKILLDSVVSAPGGIYPLRGCKHYLQMPSTKTVVYSKSMLV